MRVLPRTLTSRLVVTSVALVALVSLMVALVTTLAMSRYLTSRLDEQLTGVQERFVGPDEGRSARGADEPDHGPGGGRGSRQPCSPDTLVVDLGVSSAPDGVVTDTGGFTAVSAATLSRLRDLPEDEPRTVSLLSLGDYRVLVQDTPDGGTVAVAVGLPTEEIRRTTHNLLLSSILLALLGVLVAALLGTLLVRRQLRPLVEVASTAYDVTSMPLAAGGQQTETRVDPAYTDPSTEVGRVGSALNTPLDHVDAALDQRHRSEEQVRQFVADASHELRTPLATIHGYAELSRRTPGDAGAALAAAMGKVETEATRMSSLVSDMLLLARLDSGRPLAWDEVDLTRLLLEAVADARVVAPEHRWRLDLPGEPVTVLGDEPRLHQAVTNLLNNARRHTPPGTTVTVGAQDRAAPGEQVGITVHDDGPGMLGDLVTHAFERFTRGDSSRTRASGGVGLGLSIVQAVVVAHGGSTRVTSRPGSTTFVLSLP